MEFRQCKTDLVREGLMPEDSQVVSTNNKLVAISPEQGVVYRVSKAAGSNLRDDPHDLGYSHRVSWYAAQEAPVVSPLDREPLTAKGYVISRYPLMIGDVHLSENNADEIFTMTQRINSSLSTVSDNMTLRSLNIPEYVGSRIEDLEGKKISHPGDLDYIRRELTALQHSFPFSELTKDDTGLIHGDFKIENIVSDAKGNLRAIDLDAAAVGPRLYDLSSWRLRQELGDKTPVESVIEIARKKEEWNDDYYKALIGWKAVSSMSFTLRYEDEQTSHRKINEIARAAIKLGGLLHHTEPEV